MNPQAINFYINWLLYAVLGRMNAADQLLNKYRSSIYSVATRFQKIQPPPITQLYRGILVEPENVIEGCISPDPRLTFLSFSEDKNCAAWFADKHSIMSSFVVQQRPSVEGFIVQHLPRREDILFHHSWSLKNLDVPFSFNGAAKIHQDIDYTQFSWNMETQKEVILKPTSQDMSVVSYDRLHYPTTEQLDLMFCHPLFLP